MGIKGVLMICRTGDPGWGVENNSAVAPSTTFKPCVRTHRSILS
jgi:hypothetical protein